MRRIISTLLAGALLSVGAPAFAKEDKSSAKKAQDKNMTEIPVCTRNWHCDYRAKQWWVNSLSNLEAVIKFQQNRALHASIAHILRHALVMLLAITAIAARVEHRQTAGEAATM
jgi:hypothetical protein